MSRLEKLSIRLDELEAKFLSLVLGELQELAEGSIEPEELCGKYLFRRSFPDAAAQKQSDSSTWLLRAERDILAIRDKLGDKSHGTAIDLVNGFVRELKADLDQKNYQHGNSWAATARQTLKNIQTNG